MTWKNIIKAPTRNEDTQYGGGYKGTRTHSEVDDEMMAKIVKDLNLPKMDKDGEEIDYYEEPNVHLIPSLELVGEKYNGEYKLVIKFEGDLRIFATLRILLQQMILNLKIPLLNLTMKEPLH